MSTDPRSGVAPTPGNPSARVIVAPTAVASNHAAAQEWTLQIDEATLTQELNAWAAGQLVLQTPLGSARLHDLTVQLGDDHITLRGMADIAWVAEPVGLDATASVSAGSVLVYVGQAQVHDLSVPESARRALEQWLQQQLDQWVSADRVVVHSITIRSGKLVVSGTRR